MPASLTSSRGRPSSLLPRVAVTGIGLTTGLGEDAKETWNHLRAGRHAFRHLDVPTAPEMPPHLGCPLPQTHGGATETLIGAAFSAFLDAGLPHHVERDRAALVLGM